MSLARSSSQPWTEEIVKPRRRGKRLRDAVLRDRPLAHPSTPAWSRRRRHIGCLDLGPESRRDQL